MKLFHPLVKRVELSDWILIKSLRSLKHPRGTSQFQTGDLLRPENFDHIHVSGRERNLSSLTFLIVSEGAKAAEWNAIEELLLYIRTNENT